MSGLARAQGVTHSPPIAAGGRVAAGYAVCDPGRMSIRNRWLVGATAVLVGTLVGACGSSPSAAPSSTPAASSPQAPSNSPASSPPPSPAVNSRDTWPTVPSSTAGCATGATIPIGTSVRSLTVGGISRTYTVVVPYGLDTTKPAPLVVTMHGRGSNASQQLVLTGLEADSTANGYVVVAPEAIGGQWRLPLDGEVAGNMEVAYIDAVLADVDAGLCLDPSRRYASGMSMGSAMTFVLACAPQRRFAAFGGVSLTFYRPTCDASPPAPIIYFHGTADTVVPYAGGGTQVVELQPVDEVMVDWAAHNSCQVGPNATTTADVTEQTWSSCALSADVEFYRVDGGGHTWPGANPLIASALQSSLGVTTTTVAATPLMWQFFSQYRLPTAQ